VPDSALTPERALDYLHELSTDIRSAVLIDADGRVAADTGPETAEAAARVSELFERADEAAGGEGRAAQVEVVLASGAVFAVRDDAWTLAAVADRYALPSLMFYDLRSVIADLEARTE
jgi:predicted regulator of Ras-like GTPase activity (Roadblock/LC7/MglB family)